MKSCCKEVAPDKVPEQASGKDRKGVVKWVKRLGVAGFLFFLIKGILWLTVGAAVLKYLGCKS